MLTFVAMLINVERKMTWMICAIFIFGLAVMGTGQVLCVGDDGHMEIETYCMPCCGDADESCQYNLPEDHHGEHNECSNCDDFELNSPIWSNRNDSNLTEEIHVSGIDYLDYSPGCFLTLNSDSKSIQFYIPTGQDPPSDIVTFTVLRC